jgi:hypothetical protein
MAQSKRLPLIRIPGRSSKGPTGLTETTSKTGFAFAEL